MDFAVDNFELARTFILDLPQSVKRARFTRNIGKGMPKNWNPTHLVLALKNGAPVAMADTVESNVGSTASATIVARKGCGGHAIKALIIMKNAFPKENWVSTLMKPTPTLITISKRFMNETYDQGAHEISQELLKQHGMQHYFTPTPLFPSFKTLTRLQLPNIEMFDDATKYQVLKTALDPMSVSLKAPNGDILDTATLLSLAFELGNVPFSVRQNMSRFLLVNIAMYHGHNLSKENVEKISDPTSVNEFHSRINHALSNVKNSGGGAFVFTPPRNIQ